MGKNKFLNETANTAAKEDAMFVCKKRVEDKLRPLAELAHKFQDEVNVITNNEAKFFRWNEQSPEHIVSWCCSEVCDIIIESRMSEEKKIRVLCGLDSLVKCAEMGGICDTYKDMGIWDDAVRKEADERIAEHRENNK